MQNTSYKRILILVRSANDGSEDNNELLLKLTLL